MSVTKSKLIGIGSLSLIIIVIFLLFYFGSNHSEINDYNSKTSVLNNQEEISSNQSYTFVLTHLLDKKLIKDAHFSVGNMKVWELDFQNGQKIRYTIVYMNPDNPMCGITAKDNLGDNCEICITKTSGDGTRVDFKYGSRILTYRGYLLR